MIRTEMFMDTLEYIEGQVVIFVSKLMKSHLQSFLDKYANQSQKADYEGSYSFSVLAA